MANAKWGSRPEMMSVGEFAAEVALLPLIFGNLQINRLVLRDADILIETDAEGRSNLDFSGTEKNEAPNEDAPNLPQINDVLIENAVFTIVNGADRATSKFEVKRLSAKAKNLSSPLAIDVTGVATIEEQAIEFAAEGDLGAPKLLLAATEPYPVNLTLTGLGLIAKIDGTIADLTEITGLDLNFEVSGPDLQGLVPLAGDGLPTAGPITLAATIKGNGENAVLETIALQIGKTDVAGSMSIDMRGKRPRIEGTLHAGQIDVTELLPGDEKEPNGPDAGQNSGGEASKSTGEEKLFPADPLPLDILKAFDANLDIAITQLVLPGMTLADAKGVLALDNGALALKPLSASLVGSAVTGDIGVDTRSGPASVSLNLKAPQLDMGELLRELADLDQLRGGGAVDVSLRGTGTSVAEIMASLNGHSRFLMDEGEVKNEFLGTVSGLSQTIGEAFGKKEWIAVECIASDFEVANGVANSRINVINTELLLITTEGKVDLAQEKPDLKVSPNPKGIDLSLAVPVNVGGSLANPSFTPDTLATAKKIGGILGAVAFPPAALIGLTELGGGDNPCLQTAKADSPQPQPEPSPPETPVEAVTDTAKDAIEGVGKGLKKLFGN
jgi:uncharacterized protein involved in outer membrane biogenesis